MREGEDTDLLLAAGGGDRDAFATLVERHHRTIVQFVYRFLGGADGATAEDLAQDIFLSAWRSAPSFEPRAKVTTWLLRIARNTCLNHRRSRRLRKAVSLDSLGEAAVHASSPPPDTGVMADETARCVRTAILDLPPNQQGAIILRHFHGLSYADIAEVLGVSVSAVESMLFRARQTLRTALGEAKLEGTPQVSPPSGA